MSKVGQARMQTLLGVQRYGITVFLLAEALIGKYQCVQAFDHRFFRSAEEMQLPHNGRKVSITRASSLSLVVAKVASGCHCLCCINCAYKRLS